MSDHAHSWQPLQTMNRERVSASPCSTWDDHLWEDVIAVQSCECGATRQLLLGYKNRRRRGDDGRIAKGLDPLGTPLRKSGTYKTPKVISTSE